MALIDCALWACQTWEDPARGMDRCGGAGLLQAWVLSFSPSCLLPRCVEELQLEEPRILPQETDTLVPGDNF